MNLAFDFLFLCASSQGIRHHIGYSYRRFLAGGGWNVCGPTLMLFVFYRMVLTQRHLSFSKGKAKLLQLCKQNEKSCTMPVFKEAGRNIND